MSLKLIYFKGCPNVEKAKKLVSDGGHVFIEVCQDNLSEGDPMKCYSSPTLLKNNKIIFGSEIGSGGGCSVGLPNMNELTELIDKS